MNEQERRDKSAAMFNEYLEENGGVYDLFEVIELTGLAYQDIMQLTVDKKLISLVRKGKGLIFPKTQFHSQCPTTYIGRCYSFLPEVSDIMLYSFFYSDRYVQGYSMEGGKDKIIDILKDNPTESVLLEVFRHARLFGTMDAI